MSTSPKLVDFIICDDIRAEVGNKTTLIGIYRKALILPAVPFNLPQLCFVMKFDMSKSTAKKYTFRVKMPGNQTIGPLKADMPSELKKVHMLTLSVFPVEIKETGTCEAFISFDGKKEIKLGKIEVELATKNK